MYAYYTNIIPPVLKTWDAGAFPYYLVSFIYEKGKTDWNRVRLTYAAQPFEYSDGTITNAGKCYFTEYSNGSWDSSTHEIDAGEMSYKPGLTGNVFSREWTSHDIPGLMKAGGITPGALITNNQELWTGYAMGCASKGRINVTEEKIVYVVGEPINFTLNAADWNGTSCSIKADGYSIGKYGVQIGIPAEGSIINSQSVIKSGLTIVKATATAATETTEAYVTIDISATSTPTEDIVVSLFGLEPVSEVVA